MTATVRLVPSGHAFPVEAHETVLDAGLRSGVALRYRCINGSCGECRGRVLAGRAREVRFHDFVLSDAEKQAGYVLLCCTGADSDLEIEAAEIGGAEEIPYQEIEARVAKLERLREDLLLMHVRTPRSQALQFLPGQCVALTLPGLLPRYRSVASCPCNGVRLEFHIRRMPGDAFSQYVFSRLKGGQHIGLAGPEGRLGFDKDSTRPVIFFAYDSGFAPIKSLIEYAICLEGEQAMHLYWMALTGGQHYMDNLCRSWADALDNFAYVPLTSVTEMADDALDGEWNELSAMERVVREHPDLSGYDVYIAGPQALVSAALGLFVKNGLPEDRFFSDSLKYF